MTSTLAEVQVEQNSTFGRSDAVELSLTGRIAVWLSIASFLFFTQIAYNIGEFPAAVDFFCYALFAGYLLISGHAAVSIPILFFFTGAVALAAFRIPFSASQPSWSSLLLFSAIYLQTRLHAQPHRSIARDAPDQSAGPRYRLSEVLTP